MVFYTREAPQARKSGPRASRRVLAVSVGPLNRKGDIIKQLSVPGQDDRLFKMHGAGPVWPAPIPSSVIPRLAEIPLNMYMLLEM